MMNECWEVVDFQAYYEDINLANYDFMNLSGLAGQLSADDIDVDNVYKSATDYSYLDLEKDDYSIRSGTV